ncbi:vWA domain-containing protein [Terrabacter sp. C0L_2]|uniref:vWA domain-containing protein n=1 Tax=Terrabacter sp. C0L_2 TaxID=3108389 RepID=UPI002ED06DF5|nr:VWA domain-containing protein [Terrabacter sp. C0L_2]
MTPPMPPRGPGEGGDVHGRFRYTPWHGGPDPLAPPFDVRSALDEVGQDVLAGGSLREALRELMRRGMDGRRGLDDLVDRVRRLREAARRRGDLGGTLDQVRAMLDQALAEERDTLAGESGDDARLAEMDLATIPDDVAGAVRALGGYAWHSPEAQQTFEQIQQMLQREVVGAQFEGLKQALSGNDPQAMQAVKDMLADLNQLLAAHARGEDTEDQFRDFMDKHGDLFPEQPGSVDELIDALARRQAAADRLMASLSPEQREQLGQLMSDALGDPDLASQMAQLSDNLRALRPGLDRRSPVQQGQGEPMGYGDAVGAVAELADLEQLGEQLGQGYFGATLDDVDVERLEQYLGADAARDMEALRQLERELERQGYVSRGDDGLRLTPRAVRRLGETALKRVFERVEAAGRGDHDDRAAGQADELTGLSRQWEFGDELPIDTVRTVSNALQRNARSGGGASPAMGDPAFRRRAPAPGSGGVELLVEDFEVAETERRAVAAVALCVDMSFSMMQEGRWGPMKQTALALSHLVQTRFRHDALQIIGFNLTARRLTPTELTEAEPEWVQGTNLQHALMLASRHLRRHPDAEPVVLVVTDGEPTAHIEVDGRPTFHWPATQQTVRATVAQVDELRRSGAQLNVFMLGDDPGLARFVDAVARRAGGRVFTPDIARLGEYVVADYLRTRRGRR